MKKLNYIIVLLILFFSTAGASMADIMTSPPKPISSPNEEGKCVSHSEKKCHRVNNTNTCVPTEVLDIEHASHNGKCGVNHIVGKCVYDVLINDCKIIEDNQLCDGWSNPPNYKKCECLCKSADGSILRTADIHRPEILESKNCATDPIIIGFACDGYTEDHLDEFGYTGPKTDGVYSCADLTPVVGLPE